MKVHQLLALGRAWDRLRDRIPFDGYSGEIKDKTGKVVLRVGEHPLKGAQSHDEVMLAQDIETVLNALPSIMAKLRDVEVL